MLKQVVLAGGCFWGMEELFRKLPGVLDTEVGYCGGQLLRPRYSDVRKGHTGHAESIKVTYDPDQTDFKKLLHFFFSIHDPTTHNRQGNDCGSQYRSVIFVNSAEEEEIARQIITQLTQLKIWPAPIVTEVVSAAQFYPAEKEHQDYLQRIPDGYSCHFPRYDFKKLLK